MALDWDFIGIVPSGRETLDRLHDAWEQTRAADGRFYKRDFRPALVSDLLSFISIIEKTDTGEIIYRLYGSGLISRSGYDLTGQSVMAQFPPDVQDAFRHGYAMLFEHGVPAYHRTDIHTADGSVFGLDTFYLPMADDDGTIRFALTLYWMQEDREFMRRERQVIGYLIYPSRYWLDVDGLPLIQDIPPYEIGKTSFRKQEGARP